MRSATTLILFYFLFFLTTITTLHQNCLFCSGSNSCIQSERQALLNFKKDLKDPSNRLSSWVDASDHHEDDCCLWHGIVCDNLTGHVREIHLRNPSCSLDRYGFFDDDDDYEGYRRHLLGGKINPSLLDLKHLRYLDLSCNHFEGIPIPGFIGSLASLKYLNLSRGGFQGIIPHQLENLSMIRYLDLSLNDFEGIPIPGFIGSLASLKYLDLSLAGFRGTIPHQIGNLSMIRYLALEEPFYEEPLRLRVDNLQWLSGLVSLQHLDLSAVNLSKALDWVQVINKLPSLVELCLSYCQLKLVPPPPPINNLTSLATLDLSGNHFFSFTPRWLFSLNSLVSLNIENCNFHGPIPRWLLNLTELQDLDLFDNLFNSTIPNWLYTFKHLKSLNLGYNNLQGVVSGAIGNLTALSKLDLSSNQLGGVVPISSLGKFCKLNEISLGFNNFGGRVEEVFRNLSKCNFRGLESVNFQGNKLSGHLPDELGEFKNLAYLYLRYNSISGQIPVSIGRLSSLIELDLSNNRLKGTLPQSLGQLVKVKVLWISHNLLEGIVSDIHFANLTSLNRFVARENILTWKPSDGWVPPFQLYVLALDSWQLGPRFPLWLQSQRKLDYLSMSRTGISDFLPTWFWRKFSQFYHLNLSGNQIQGEIPRTVKFQFSVTTIDFSSNYFEGSLPNILSNVSWLDLSNNRFSGSLYRLLCGKLGKEERVLFYLNLRNNCLSGKIPDCWKNWPYLKYIKLENNNLMGMIPQSIGHLTSLQALHLRQTNLSGKLPQSLQNCTELLIIDLRQNEFTGSIPSWMGYSFSKLVILNIRSNKFQGHIPFQLCRLSCLQILDLAYNNLSGSIPSCFHNFSVMAANHDTSHQLYYEPEIRTGNEITGYFEDIFLVTKGREFEYNTILNLVTSMDLSENNLHGEIPKGLTRLAGLWSLNLSGNCLTGTIPDNIGDMRQLESLDFSANQLFGNIPLSMSTLSFLSYLNLSYNELVGQIPSSTQLQSFTESSFVGNKLCGPPLPTCNANKKPPGDDHDKDNGDEFAKEWLYASSALGFVIGFWAVLGPLLFKMSWRIAYFRFLDGIGHKLCNVIFYFRYK